MKGCLSEQNRTEIQIKKNKIKKYMGIILWIIFGAITGWLASIIMKTDAQQDGLLNIVVGIVGAVVGGWLTNFFGVAGITGFNLYSFVVAIMGAIVLIAVVKMLKKS